MKEAIAIHWFRQDLRLSDNPALTLAARHGNVLPVYILDDEQVTGSASRWWLHHSLESLNQSLNGKLSIYHGDSVDIIIDIAMRFNVQAVYWNRCYEPLCIKRDVRIKNCLKNKNIQVQSTNSALLWEPWTIKKADGSPYQLFTSFYRKGCLQAAPPRQPLPNPQKVNYQKDNEHTLHLSQLKLLPSLRWDKKFESCWQIGEDKAQNRLQQFIDESLSQYKDGRNFPAQPFVSKLSPHLHFGEISPNQIWHELRKIGDNKHIEHFCSELGWREFSYNKLYYHPGLPMENLQTKFDAFAWVEDQSLLTAWQKGQTGIPMVDAGMRELWQTGYMHNRVRMITGSFLVKNLRLHWHHGQAWFWDTLIDADLANNSFNWQWVAGCGADAAPYFRIFNPVLQGQKFDPGGAYVRNFIPEIAAIPDKYLFNPWEAPVNILKQSGIRLGETYPFPVVDLKQSRDDALQAFRLLVT